MKNKLIVVGTLAFIGGGAIGGTCAALFVAWKTVRYETDAMVIAVAESTFSVIPAVLALGTDDQATRLETFKSAARSQLSGGVAIMHSRLDQVSEERREHIEGVLRSIARSRAKLSPGKIDDPPNPSVEVILTQYDR